MFYRECDREECSWRMTSAWRMLENKSVGESWRRVEARSCAESVKSYPVVHFHRPFSCNKHRVPAVSSPRHRNISSTLFLLFSYITYRAKMGLAWRKCRVNGGTAVPDHRSSENAANSNYNVSQRFCAEPNLIPSMCERNQASFCGAARGCKSWQARAQPSNPFDCARSLAGRLACARRIGPRDRSRGKSDDIILAGH